MGDGKLAAEERAKLRALANAAKFKAYRDHSVHDTAAGALAVYGHVTDGSRREPAQ